MYNWLVDTFQVVQYTVAHQFFKYWNSWRKTYATVHWVHWLEIPLHKPPFAEDFQNPCNFSRSPRPTLPSSSCQPTKRFTYKAAHKTPESFAVSWVGIEELLKLPQWYKGNLRNPSHELKKKNLFHSPSISYILEMSQHAWVFPKPWRCLFDTETWETRHPIQGVIYPPGCNHHHQDGGSST